MKREKRVMMNTMIEPKDPINVDTSQSRHSEITSENISYNRQSGIMSPMVMTDDNASANVTTCMTSKTSNTIPQSNPYFLKSFMTSCSYIKLMNNNMHVIKPKTLSS